MSTRYEFTQTGVIKSNIDLPKSNVLLYELGGDKGLDWACARPSGTEPKLKIYFGCYDKDEAAALLRLASTKQEVSRCKIKRSTYSRPECCLAIGMTYSYTALAKPISSHLGAM